MAKWVETGLADLHTKNVMTLADIVNKPIGKNGEVFITKDMTKVPKV